MFMLEIGYSLPVVIFIFYLIVLLIVMFFEKKDKGSIIKVVYMVLVISTSFIHYFFPGKSYGGDRSKWPIYKNVFIPFKSITDGSLSVESLLIHGILFLLISFGICMCSKSNMLKTHIINSFLYIGIFSVLHMYYIYTNGLKVDFLSKPFYIDEIIVESISVIIGVFIYHIISNKMGGDCI